MLVSRKWKVQYQSWTGGAGKNTARERTCFVGCVFRSTLVLPGLFPCVFQPVSHPGAAQSQCPPQMEKWKAAVIEVSCRSCWLFAKGFLQAVRPPPSGKEAPHLFQPRQRVFFQNIVEETLCFGKDVGNFQRKLGAWTPWWALLSPALIDL